MARKTFIGKIVSNKMFGTVVVDIERRIAHPVYKKRIRRNKKLLADTQGIELALGDTVKIEETRPISKRKNFKVTEVIKS